jgi:hypothetical protein
MPRPTFSRGSRIRLACASGKLATVTGFGPYADDVRVKVDGERAETIVDRSHVEAVQS